MKINNHKLLLAASALATVLVASCNGGPGNLQNVIAQRFLGSAPVSVSGPDAGNAGASAEAGAMVSGRRFDFTPSGFMIASGPVSSEGTAGSDYGVAGGTLDVAGDTATVDLDVFSTNPDVDNARLVGSFSLSEAAQAMTNPGDSFLMNWDVSFDYLGFPVQLEVQQQLTGSDFIEQ